MAEDEVTVQRPDGDVRPDWRSSSDGKSLSEAGEYPGAWQGDSCRGMIAFRTIPPRDGGWGGGNKRGEMKSLEKERERVGEAGRKRGG